MDLDSALTGKPSDGAGATELLRADHREIRQLLAEYDKDADSPHAQKVTARTLFIQLELHDQIERDILYPALAELGIGDLDAMLHEHDRVMQVVRELRDRAEWDAKAKELFRGLSAEVDAHLRAEEDALFPGLERADAARLAQLADAIVALKEELTRSTQEFENPAT